jgi:hypothetical protein
LDTRRTRRLAPQAGRSLSFIVAALVAAPITIARADEPTAEQTAAARALGMEGVRLADSGDCPKAIDPLTRAESLHHAPTTLERLGECHIAVGKLVIGTEELNRVIHEPLAPNAPPAFTAAQERAKGAIDAALAKIGKLRIHVERPAGVDPKVKVDDDAVMTAMLDADRPTDPGTHKVTATAQGMKPAETSITLANGQSQSVSLTLEPDPNAVVAPPVPAPGVPAATGPASAPAEPPPAAAPKSKVPAIVAFSAGGVGLVVGSIFGAMALGTKSSLDKACPSKTDCPATSQSDISSLGTNATVSTIGFGVGIVGVGLGTVLLIMESGSSSPPATAARATPAAPKSHVTPYFGLGTAGVTGTF